MVRYPLNKLILKNLIRFNVQPNADPTIELC